MKKIVSKTLILAALTLSLTGCVQEDDAVLPPVREPFYSETFDGITQAEDGMVFDFEGWTNYAEAGTKLWTKEVYRGDGTPQFNPYGSNQAQNIAWLITPKIEFEGRTNVGLVFDTAQNFVTDAANTVKVYASTDFDGTNVLDATWVPLDARIADKDSQGYEFVHSGQIDLADFEEAGFVYIGFRAVGSGSNNNLDGLFQINDLHLYTK